MKNLLFTLFIGLNSIVFAQHPPVQMEPPLESAPQSIQKDSNVIHTVVDETAEFPDGREALVKYLEANMKYPLIAREASLQGKCFLKFIVHKNGTITDIQVVKGVKDCPECDKEAVRIVKKMPKWLPAKINGKLVDSYFYLPIVFKLT